MYAGPATKSKLGLVVDVVEVPLMPGAAAKALIVSIIATATIGARSRVCKIAFFMFVALMAALLIDVNFGHQSAEVLCVVGEVVKIGGIEVVDFAGRVSGPIRLRQARIENHVKGFAARQGDRVGRVVQVVA